MTRIRQHVRTSKKKVKKAKKKAPKASVDDLLKAGAAAMESLDVERAYQAYHQVASRVQFENIDTNTANKQEMEMLIHVLEKMGECQVSIGDQDLAKDHFVKCLQILEEVAKTDSVKNSSYYETRSSLCFYIGQLSLENEALEAYQQGVRSLEECMQRIEDESSSAAGEETEIVSMQDEAEGESNNDLSMKIDADDSLKVRTSLKQKLSGAYCNIAELYLTDLCEQETAESDCEHYLEKALQLKDSDGEPLVDALQTMASLRLSQRERQHEAVPFILRAYEKQRVGSEALASLVGLQVDSKLKDEGKGESVPEKDQAKELVEVEAANNLPEFEFRCQTAKLLLECAGLLNETGKSQDVPSNLTDQEDECIAAAISVLGSLLAQNDEVIEIWYLTGCAFAAKKPPLIDTSKFYLQRAKEMLADIRKALQEEAQFVDDSSRQDLMEQLEMNATQMNDVQSKLDELPNETEDSPDDKMMDED